MLLIDANELLKKKVLKFNIAGQTVVGASKTKSLITETYLKLLQSDYHYVF